MRKPKKEDEVEVEGLQSAQTIGKAPILNFLELIAQTQFVENNQDDDDSKINPLLHNVEKWPNIL